MTLSGALICIITLHFHTPKVLYGSHLYVGAIEIENVFMNHQKNG